MFLELALGTVPPGKPFSLFLNLPLELCRRVGFFPRLGTLPSELCHQASSLPQPPASPRLPAVFEWSGPLIVLPELDTCNFPCL